MLPSLFSAGCILMQINVHVAVGELCYLFRNIRREISTIFLLHLMQFFIIIIVALRAQEEKRK